MALELTQNRHSVQATCPRGWDSSTQVHATPETAQTPFERTGTAHVPRTHTYATAILRRPLPKGHREMVIQSSNRLLNVSVHRESYTDCRDPVAATPPGQQTACTPPPCMPPSLPCLAHHWSRHRPHCPYPAMRRRSRSRPTAGQAPLAAPCPRGTGVPKIGVGGACRAREAGRPWRGSAAATAGTGGKRQRRPAEAARAASRGPRRCGKHAAEHG